MNGFPLVLFEEDLKRIGNTTYGHRGMGTNFILDGNKCHHEIFFLRSILTPLGYKILSEKDYVLENGECDVEVETDYPWDQYMEIGSKK
jgi:hypothetical protein